MSTVLTFSVYYTWALTSKFCFEWEKKNVLPNCDKNKQYDQFEGNALLKFQAILGISFMVAKECNLIDEEIYNFVNQRLKNSEK